MKNLFVIIVVLFCSISVSRAQEAKFVPFTSEIASAEFIGMWYVTQDKRRYDGTDRTGRINPPTQNWIIRYDLGKVWVLYPETKTYKEMNMTEEQKREDKTAPYGKLYKTIDYKGQSVDQYVPNAKTTLYYIHGTKVPLRVERIVGNETHITEFTNIQMQEPSSDVFEIPLDYVKK